MAYIDLMELARLCLRQASAARTPAAANELQRMAKEYQARADALLEGHGSEVADVALGRPVPDAPSSTVQQQQQPQVEQGGDEAESSPKRS